jgi:hypothetical protein
MLPFRSFSCGSPFSFILYRNEKKQRYREGGVFKSSEYTEDDDFRAAWKHMRTGIFVWKDAIDLSTKPNPKCFFHYTGHLAWILQFIGCWT